MLVVIDPITNIIIALLFLKNFFCYIYCCHFTIILPACQVITFKKTILHLIFIYVVSIVTKSSKAYKFESSDN
ncbi:MAG: hypothetical protein ACJAX4_003948 [Clostridium sp.]|jgi:hypothetical protein